MDFTQTFSSPSHCVLILWIPTELESRLWHHRESHIHLRPAERLAHSGWFLGGPERQSQRTFNIASHRLTAVGGGQELGVPTVTHSHCWELRSRSKAALGVLKQERRDLVGMPEPGNPLRASDIASSQEASI